MGIAVLTFSVGRETMMKLWRGTVLTLLLLAGLAQTAFAAPEKDLETEKEQAQEKDRGFHVGKLIIHPGISLQNVYGTNVNQTNANNSTIVQDLATNRTVSVSGSKEAADDSLRVIGGLKMNYPSQNIRFSMDAQLQYAHYFGLSNQDASVSNGVTQPKIDTSNMSGISGMGRLALSIFPEAVVSGNLADTYTYSTLPQNVALNQTMAKHTNKAKVGLGIKPGGGQLRLNLGYQNIFENYSGESLKALNALDHEFSLNIELEFLPKTAWYLFGSYSMHDYYDWKLSDTNSRRISPSDPSSSPLRVITGLYGRITGRFSLNGSVGYGNTFNASDTLENYNMLLAKLEGIVKFSERTQLKFGFERDFRPLVTYAWRADNKPYLELKQWFVSDQIKLYLYFAYSFVQYGEPDKALDANETTADTIESIPKRTDHDLLVRPSFRYEPLSWIALELAYNMNLRYVNETVTRTLLTSDNQAVVTTTDYDLVSHEVLLNFRWSIDVPIRARTALPRTCESREDPGFALLLPNVPWFLFFASLLAVTARG